MKFTPNDFRGIFPAFNSLFDKNDKVNVTAVKALARKYCELGVGGLYLCGSTGEGFLMNNEERMELTAAVCEEVGSEIPIIVHVGAAATRDSVLLAKHAEKCGAAAVSAVPCVYYRMSEASIERHWSAIIDATELPFIIYNIPQTTGYNLSLELFARMAAKPKVAGIKNSSEAGCIIERFKTLGGVDFVVFNGPDEQYLGGRMMGADAGIGGTYGAMPELYIALDKRICRGDMAGAKELQRAVNDCVYSLLAFPSLFGAAKAVITLRYGIEAGVPREPFIASSPDDPKIISLVEKIEGYIKKYCVD